MGPTCSAAWGRVRPRTPDPARWSGHGHTYFCRKRRLSYLAADALSPRKTNAAAGGSVSGAGDVNGDGLADVIVGAFKADPGGNSNAGESYVIFGKADGTPVDLADVAAGSGGFVINGIDPNDATGWSVSRAGDVNGDELDDLIVGAQYADPGGNSAAGESYVIFGKADGMPVDLVDVAAGSGGFVINGSDPSDTSGSSVSGAADVNGDGLDDLIVGARYAESAGGNSNAGQSYVVFGKADGAAVELSDVVAGTGGFVMNGIDTNDDSGWGVSGAGDVNGDGLDDLIVGAPHAEPGGNFYAGESYVVFSPFGLDCNGNGIPDFIDIADGTSEDRNADGIPDECACPWDLDGSGSVGTADLLDLLSQWGDNPAGPPDFDGSGSVGTADLLKLLSNWGSCPK